jgi:serine/threonine-protein kinase
MGAVYRAYDSKLQRDVAIKLLTHGTDDTARDRLLREARAPSALNHPNICTVHEVEDTGAHAFIVMEYIDGQPLSQLIPRQGLPIDSAVKYALQIADALAHAHVRGIVHGDVKPSNVLITVQGRTKVVDFGLAKRMSAGELTDAVTRATESGVVGGTLPYMAPEQLRGEPASARTDVWALGALVYEMIAGQPPFQGATPFVLSSAIMGDALRPLPAHVPAGLKNLIQRCLAKDPGERYAQAGEARAVLETLQSGTHETPARSSSSRRKPPRARVRALAVLPLESLSSNPDEEYFADGMTDTLITTLAQIGALRVISRTSVMRYKGARRPLPEIARELSVDAVVEGTVVRSGDRVRISAQLIHAATDTHLWAKQYESSMRDVLTLQSDVARAIANEIQIQLTPQEKLRLAGARPVDPGAYEAFLKGRHLWYRRSPDALQKALEYLQQAVSIDPTYALAHAGLADVYISLSWDLFGLMPPAEGFPRAKAAAQKALELDPHCAEAHAALGWAAAGYDWDWASAERGLKRAIELKPQYGPVHIWYSHFLKAIDRIEESFGESRRALECDPLGLVLNMHMGWHHLYSRKYAQAIDQLLKTLELDPNFILTRVFLGESYLCTGRPLDAIAELERAVELSQRHPTYLGDLGYAYAFAGRRDDAVKTLDELMRLSSHRYVGARSIAEIYLGLGDADQAFDWLNKAFEQRNGWLIHIRENPRYDAVRHDPRYQSLVRRMRFPA